jgi:hypothetical protein
MLSVCAFSQEAKESNNNSKTKIETILKSEGVIFSKEYEELFTKDYSGSTINFQSLKITSLSNNQSIYGLYIQANKYETPITRSSVAFIDENEIPGLINFLKLVEGKLQGVENKHIEYHYLTKDLDITLFNSNTNPTKVFSKKEDQYLYWNIGFTVGRIGSVTALYNNPDFIGKLITALQDRKVKQL